MHCPPDRTFQAKSTGLAWLIIGLALPLMASLFPGIAAAQRSAARPQQSQTTLQSLVEPLWTDLKPEQRSVLEPFGNQWNTWAAQEKRVWISLADKWPQYTAAQQERAKQRIKIWAALTPEQRRVARSNYRLAKKLPKAELTAQTRRYEDMTPEQRAVLRENGSTSNTAAKYGGARSGLAKDAAQPLARSASAALTSTRNGAAAAASSLKP